MQYLYGQFKDNIIIQRKEGLGLSKVLAYLHTTNASTKVHNWTFRLKVL